MYYFKIILYLAFFIFVGCGKSPLLNKLEKSANTIGGITLIKNNSITFNWIIPPSLTELSAFEITFESALTEDQSVKAYLWMPDMGHGSSPIEILKINELNYYFSELAFIMPGLWVLHIEILQNNQVVDQWQKSITL